MQNDVKKLEYMQFSLVSKNNEREHRLLSAENSFAD